MINMSEKKTEVKIISDQFQKLIPSWLQLNLNVIKNLIKKIFKNLFHADKWNIGVINAPVEKFLSPQFVPDVTWMKEQPGTSFALDRNGSLQDTRVGYTLSCDGNILVIDAKRIKFALRFLK